MHVRSIMNQIIVYVRCYSFIKLDTAHRCMKWRYGAGSILFFQHGEAFVYFYFMFTYFFGLHELVLGKIKYLGKLILVVFYTP